MMATGLTGLRNTVLLVLFSSLVPTIEGESNVTLLLCDRGQIRTLSITDTVVETGTIKSPEPVAIVFDPVEKQIYWTDLNEFMIKKSDLDGLNITDVVAVNRSYGLALDSQTRQLFYTEYAESRISVFNLTSQTGQVVVKNESLVNIPYGIALDEESRRLYWVNGAIRSGSVASANYNGSDGRRIYATGQIMPLSIAVDTQNKIVYWGSHNIDGGNAFIGSIYLNGTYSSWQSNAIVNTQYAGIAVWNSTLYITDSMNSTLLSMSTTDFTTTVLGKYDAVRGLCVLTGGSTAPQASIPAPDVDIQLVHTGDSTSELEFLCNVSQQAAAVTYKTNWFVDGRLIFTTPSANWDGGDLIRTQRLKESHLKAASITTFGIKVSCSLEVTDQDGSVTKSALANSKFVGIKLSKTANVEQGSSAIITLQLTAPFGCGSKTDLTTCKLHIRLYTPDIPTTCDNSGLLPLSCGAVFEALRWNEPVTITVFGQITNIYGVFNTVVYLNLQTASTQTHAMWGQYNFHVKVTVIKRSTDIQFKSCSSYNDPHLTTFDGRRYECQFEGVFTLYKHNTLPVEVQIKTFRCGSRAFCNCGIAVRAGRMVFELNRCPGQSAFWTIGFSLYGDEDDVLQVWRRGSSYEIYLPTGAKVRVSAFSRYLNVQMYPSVQDVEQSAGLCGRLSANGSCSDDFFLRDGSYSTDPTANGNCWVGSRVWQNVLIQFANSWRVDDKNSLFNIDEESGLGAKLTSWPTQSIYCFCPESGQAVCSAGKSFSACKTLPYYATVAPSKNKIGRRKRATRSVPVKAPIVKRQATGTWPTGWNESTATAHCDTLFENSKTVQACKGVEGVETNGSLDSCLMDIWLTGTTDFGKYTLETVESKCLNELVVNPALSKPDPATGKSVFDEIVAQACPGDCNGKGTCTEGKCVCQPKFGGEDCSIDLTVGPVLAEVGTDGLCDTKTEDCSSTSVRGETFVESGAMCRIERIVVKISGQELKGSSSVAADVKSISNVHCSISTKDTTTGSDVTEFVMAYRISVANTKDVYSSTLGLMVYDSTCIKAYVNGTNFKWTKEGPYCLYKGQCIADKGKQPGNACLVCKAADDTWTPITGDTCGSGGKSVKPVWRELSFLASLALLCLNM